MVEQYLVISWVIFLWLLLALQVKVGKVASFVGKIRGHTFNHESHKYFAPQNLPSIRYLYHVCKQHCFTKEFHCPEIETLKSIELPRVQI